MNSTKFALIGLILILGSLLIGYSLAGDNIKIGSMGDDLSYKVLSSSNASTTSAIPVRGGAGVLGSIVISSTSSVALSLYDGTSTTTGMQLIATFPVNSAQGTYEFNATVLKGIVASGGIGFNGVYTINYK